MKHTVRGKMTADSRKLVSQRSFFHERAACTAHCGAWPRCLPPLCDKCEAGVSLGTMTRYLCSPDSFKESLSAGDVAEAMHAGILRADPHAEVTCLPLADGGEGTMETLAAATSGTIVEVPAHDALRRPITAHFALLGEVGGARHATRAVVETAEAGGLARLQPHERSIRTTTSYGTGELIKAALDRGVRQIIVALGGTASNDAGAGLITALGARILDSRGRRIGMSGGSLAHAAAIDISQMDTRIAHTSFMAASDVTNPLVGPTGATAVFGPQKGGNASDIDAMEEDIAHFAEIIRRDVGVDVASLPGAGAAGGIGVALIAFLGAHVEPGFDVVAQTVNLEEAVAEADVVFTGEGRIDEQTQFGKVPQGVATVAQKYQKPVVALAGSIGRGSAELYGTGMTAIFGITPGASPLEDLLEPTMASANISRTAEQVVRLLNLKN
jgi:glycerate kinase